MKTNKKIFLILTLLFMFICIPKVNAMQIFVKKTCEQNIVVEVESSDTIEALKQKIYKLDNNFLPKNQRLSFNGKVMQEGRTLADYNIEKDDTIDLSIVFKVVLDANGGKFTDSEQYIIEEWDNAYYDNLIVPAKEGYTFKGYYTEKENGAKLEMILNESGIDSDMTFYAHWEEASLIIPPISDDIENPQTSDNISVSIILLVVSLIGLSSLIIIGKKNINNN